jgi:hypothetical protein
MDKESAIEKLDLDNFPRFLLCNTGLIWSFRIEMMLKHKELWTVVITEQAPEGAGAAAFKVKDEKALALIGLNVMDHHVATLRTCKTSFEAWKKFEGIYKARSVARRLQLRQTLSNLRKMSGEALSKYFARAQGIMADLTAAGDTITETEVVMAVLNGLPEEYKMLVTILESSDGELKLDKILSKLLGVEQKQSRQEEADTKAFFTKDSGSGPVRECYYCGKKGHVKAECRKRIEDERKSKGKKERKKERSYACRGQA